MTLSVVLVVGGCAPEPAAPPPPNVVLLVLDTLRADHLGCYGYARDTSPRIDSFAAGATRYARAISSAPWTVPSHASMFTGKPPFQHGAHTFQVAEPGPNVNPLHGENLTLAEVLSAEGYRTGAFVSNVAYLSRTWKLDQGFDTYEVERVYADELNERVFDWLDATDDRPFFLFVNYIDTHAPYNTKPRPGLLDEPVEQTGRELLKQLIQAVMPAKEPVPADLVRRIVNQYDTSVANVDEQVGALLDRLDKLGLSDDTVVVVTSDHGEFFGEHHLVEHSKDVYQEVLAVPLLVRQSGQEEGRVVEQVVASSDLPQLVLSGFPEPLRSRSMRHFPDAPGGHPVIAENYFTRRKDLFHEEWGWRFQRVRRALYDWPYKYIDSSDGKHELYRLDEDPGEADNRMEREPDVARKMAATLAEFTASRPRPGEAPELTPLDEEQRERLKALGYLD